MPLFGGKRISPPFATYVEVKNVSRQKMFQRLDEAVFAAYGWKSDLSDEKILEKLLALNLERAKR
jgi:hypothetical protein